VSRLTLPQRAMIHADNMQSEGWYTTANVLAECAEVLDAAEALRAATQSSVGHIEKARKHATANSNLQIEMACDKLLEAVAAFERRRDTKPV
jgi:hypothetical protein